MPFLDTFLPSEVALLTIVSASPLLPAFLSTLLTMLFDCSGANSLESVSSKGADAEDECERQLYAQVKADVHKSR